MNRRHFSTFLTSALAIAALPLKVFARPAPVTAPVSAEPEAFAYGFGTSREAISLGADVRALPNGLMIFRPSRHVFKPFDPHMAKIAEAEMLNGREMLPPLYYDLDAHTFDVKVLRDGVTYVYPGVSFSEQTDFATLCWIGGKQHLAEGLRIRARDGNHQCWNQGEEFTIRRDPREAPGDDLYIIEAEGSVQPGRVYFLDEHWPLDFKILA